MYFIIHSHYKNIGYMCKGASKQPPDLKIYNPPPRFRHCYIYILHVPFYMLTCLRLNGLRWPYLSIVIIHKRYGTDCDRKKKNIDPLICKYQQLMMRWVYHLDKNGYRDRHINYLGEKRIVYI